MGKGKLNVSRIGTRFCAKLSVDGPDEALRYAVAVMGQYGTSKRLNMELQRVIPQSLRVCFDAATLNLKQRRESRLAKQRTQQETELRATENRSMALCNQLEAARVIGMAGAAVATMTMEERRMAGATRMEIAEAVKKRRNAIRASRVKELLECTDTELKRWSEDGRLPVMFRRRIPISVARKTLDVRHWSLDMVTEAKIHIPTWREEDAMARRERRRTRCAKKIQ